MNAVYMPKEQKYREFPMEYNRTNSQQRMSLCVVLSGKQKQ